MMSINHWKERYRVDNVPLLIRPIWLIISSIVGRTQYYLLHVFPHYTSRIEIIGPDPRQSRTPCIYAIWHSEIFAMFTALRRIPGLYIINHPAWYMKSTHVLLRCFGVERIFLGSTGHGGKEAAQKLANFLLENQGSSFINPDGPSGPYHVLKRGVLHLAAQSELPIVPVAIRATRALRLRGWDRKLIPLPFGRIEVKFGDPIKVTGHNFLEAEEILRVSLGG